MRAPLLHITIGSMSLLAAIQCPAQANDYPAGPVKMVVPYPPGGAVDVMARAIAPKLSERLNGKFYVENLPGAGGDIGTRTVAVAPADGQTILIISPDFVVRPLVKSNVPYDPIKSFAPVTLVATSPAMISVHSSVPVKNMKELIALLKANPGKYSYATPGYGTAPHLEGERLYRMSYGVDVLHVPFQGFAPAVTSTIAGHTAILGAPIALVAPHITGGTLRGLAVASKKRSAALPEVPTLEEGGVLNQEAGFAGGVLVPASTPREIVSVLQRQIAEIVLLPDVREQLAKQGFDPIANMPEEFAAWIKAELIKWGEVVRAANIKIE
jgi:tripartite-type tricarboxylate transporter receptor subunit TctC